MTSEGRPPLGDIKVGDRVHVTRHTRELYEGVVTKVARVWITVARVGAEEWSQDRFRKDTQDTGDAYGSYTRFETPEQYAWSRRESAAYAFLREQKIDVFTGPWAKRRPELANIIRRHEGMEEL